jgi:thiol-disulfide isomerase/thioredoxin
MRGLLLFSVLGLVLLGATCRGNEKPAPAPPQAPEPAPEPAAAQPAVLDIEGIDIGAVRPEQRADLFRLLNETFCYCGCPRTVASCLAAKADCSCVKCSERMANFILQHMSAGLTTEEVEIELLDGFTEGFNGAQREIDVADRPTKGPAGAKYTLVEFADFRCGHCRAAFPVINQIVESNPEVRVVWFNYPLGPPGDNPSVLAAEAAEEARAQGKFWELAEILFRYQHAIDAASLPGYAEQAGLDVARFKAAMDKRIHKERVLADKKIGQSLNVESTPSIFVNGRPFGLSRTAENFKLRLQMEAERGRCD